MTISSLLPLALLLAEVAGLEPAPDAAAAFAIPWASVDSGGGVSSLGPYRVTGTLGQPDGALLAAGPTAVTAGFWAIGSGNPVFADGFESGAPSAWSLHVP